MAKKNKKVVLEDIELKPQVIGYTYKKKSNIGRVIFIFIIFILVIYYINDISVFINNLLGKTTAQSIKEQTNSDNKKDPNNDDDETEIVYNIFNGNLIINESGLTLNNFNSFNNILTFDANNETNLSIDLSKRKFFIETYSEDKTLLERFKVDFNIIASNSKMSFSFDLSRPIYYLVLSEKSVNDYPAINLGDSDTGISILTCTKGIENIVYSFRNNELSEITHTISDSNITDTNYYNRYNLFQNKTITYNNIDGITATFNSTLNGYTAVIDIDLQMINLNNISEKYYYGYKEEPKVVNFEMETYGFNCN